MFFPKEAVFIFLETEFSKKTKKKNLYFWKDNFLAQMLKKLLHFTQKKAFLIFS